MSMFVQVVVSGWSERERVNLPVILKCIDVGDVAVISGKRC